MQNTSELDGLTFVAMLRQGAVSLGKDKTVINDLNVFPIPDGDTGDNMCMTIDHGVAEVKDFEDICDVYIINTCTVTNNSDSKSRKMIRQAIKRNPKACVVAMGCFIASHMDYREKGLDIVLANKDK